MSQSDDVKHRIEELGIDPARLRDLGLALVAVGKSVPGLPVDYYDAELHLPAAKTGPTILVCQVLGRRVAFCPGEGDRWIPIGVL